MLRSVSMNEDATMYALTHIAKAGGHIRDLDLGHGSPLLHGTTDGLLQIADLPKEVHLLTARS